MTRLFSFECKELMLARNVSWTGRRESSRLVGGLRVGDREDITIAYRGTVPLERTEPVADREHHNTKGHQEEAQVAHAMRR